MKKGLSEKIKAAGIAFPAIFSFFLLFSGLFFAPLSFADQVKPGQTPAGITSSEWEGIKSQIEADQYKAVECDEGLRAFNKSQNWQAVFDGTGFIVTPSEKEWRWGFSLKSYGRGETGRQVRGKAGLSSEGGHISAVWDSNVTEWWINDKKGLEHGYTLKERPSGAEGDLGLYMELKGNLLPRLDQDGKGLTLVNGLGRQIVTYSGLTVKDSAGRNLPSRMTVSNNTVGFVVDDRDASYPIVIDPLAQQQAYLKASNTNADDRFGCSVSVSGDTLVVGASGEDSRAKGINGAQDDNTAFNSGAVYVFVRNGSGWSQEAYLKASNTEEGDGFGSSVSASGDTIVVGAYGERSSATGVNGDQDNNSAYSSGAAYVFVRNGTTWSQQAYLKASNTGDNDYFGWSVSVSGDTIVVGAFLEDRKSTGVNGTEADYSAYNSGAAYVFVRSGTVWSQQAYLKASNAEVFDNFGSSVSISGDTIVVGASGEDSNTTGVNGNQSDNTASYSGAAYVFVRSGTDWSQQAYLKASNTGVNDYFGWSVSVSGDTIVVGAYYEDSNSTGIDGYQSDNSASDSGAAYVFVRSGTTWSQQAYLKASNTGAGDGFGNSVSVSGDTMVVGAPNEESIATGVNGIQNDNSAEFAGAAYVFVVDKTSPSITSVTSTSADGVYGAGSTIDLTVNFSENVTLSGGNLVIDLDTGGSAVISSISDSNTASATYTVASGQNSSDLDSSSITLSNGATLKDSSGNDAVLSIPSGKSLADSRDIVIDTISFPLKVNNGVVDGRYLPGSVVSISADAPPSGQVFDKWTGNPANLANLANIYLPNTTLVMPAGDVEITASYNVPGTVAHKLTVNGGTGGGDYLPGSAVRMDADSPFQGKIFDRWTGDTNALENVLLPSTRILMQAADATVTATYRDKDSSNHTLTVTKGTGGGNYADGQTVVITADDPSQGKVFDQWTGDTSYITNINLPVTSMTMPARNAGVTAIYKDKGTKTYSLTVEGGNGGGTYSPGAEVQLSATPPDGKVFSAWKGQISWISDPYNANTKLFMPGADIKVSAEFTDIKYTLTYAAGTGGSITGSASQSVTHGGNGTEITAVASEGYAFKKWSDGSTANPRTDSNVKADLNVTAEFALIEYTLKYAAGTGGSISGTLTQTVTHGSDGSPVSAVSGSGYHFLRWNDGVSTATRKDLNVKQNISVTALFESDTPQPPPPDTVYLLVYTAGSGGMITGATSQSVRHGSSGTAVTAVPSTGFVFKKWSDGSTANPRTDSNIRAYLSVTAEFAAREYALRYTAGTGGTISGASSQTVRHGSSGTAVTAVASSGYVFKKWSDGTTINPRTDSGIMSSISVEAIFEMAASNIGDKEVIDPEETAENTTDHKNVTVSQGGVVKNFASLIDLTNNGSVFGGVISGHSFNKGLISGSSIAAGAVLDCLGGTLDNATNSGTIHGGTLTGNINNSGLISGTAPDGTPDSRYAVTVSIGSVVFGGEMAGEIVNSGIIRSVSFRPGSVIRFTGNDARLEGSIKFASATGSEWVINIPEGVVFPDPGLIGEGGLSLTPEDIFSYATSKGWVLSARSREGRSNAAIQNIPDGYVVAGGLVLTESITRNSGTFSLSIPFDPALIPAGKSEDDLMVLAFDPDTSKWMEIQARKSGNSMIFDTDIISAYAVAVKTGDGEDPVPDTDRDGIPDAIEKGAANGGDGNGDGIQDYLQANAASFVSNVGNQYVTIDVMAGLTLSECMSAGLPSSGAPTVDGVFSLGLFKFVINGVSPGGSAVLNIHLPQGSIPKTYMKYGVEPSNQVPHWYDFMFDGNNGAKIIGNIVSLYFTDAGKGDDDLSSDGRIVDLGGPVFKNSQPEPNEPDVPGKTGSGSSGPCFIGSVFG